MKEAHSVAETSHDKLQAKNPEASIPPLPPAPNRRDFKMSLHGVAFVSTKVSIRLMSSEFDD